MAPCRCRCTRRATRGHAAPASAHPLCRPQEGARAKAAAALAAANQKAAAAFAEIVAAADAAKAAYEAAVRATKDRGSPVGRAIILLRRLGASPAGAFANYARQPHCDNFFPPTVLSRGKLRVSSSNSRGSLCASTTERL